MLDGYSRDKPGSGKLALFDQWNEWLERHCALAAWSLVLIAFLVFQGTLANGFVYDDVEQLLQNPFVRNAHLWKRIFTGPVWSFLGAAGKTNFYRPLHIFSYWLVWRLAGPNATVFHLFQLALYALTVLLVFRLGRALLHNELAAFAGALLWALHPLHVEAIAWIAAVPDVGCGFFYLLGFWLFLRAEQAGDHQALRHGLAALAYLPALFFKETALSFPLLLAGYWFFHPTKEERMRRALRWLPYVGAVAGYVVIRIAALGHFSEARQFWKVPLGVIGAGLGLLGQHAKLFFWSGHLSSFRTFELGPSLRSPWPWLALLALLVACGLRKREPALGFLVVWWGVTLLPCLDIRQLSIPILAERFSYLPSVGLSLAVAFLALVWFPRLLPLRRLAPVLVPALGLVSLLWAIQDVRAVPNWRDNDALWTYSYRVAPGAATVHISRAVVLQYRDRDFDAAAREYESALRLNQNSFVPLATVAYESYLSLGQIALLKGHREEALDYFQKAVRALPSHSAAYDVLGTMYFPQQDYLKAAEYFSQAVKVSPQDLVARFYLGTCWMKLGKYREAAEQFRAAREIDPTYDQAYEAEAHALEAAGDAAGAARVRGEKPKS